MLEEELVDLASSGSDTEDQVPALTPVPVPVPAANLNAVVEDTPNVLDEAMVHFETVEMAWAHWVKCTRSPDPFHSRFVNIV
jgi:hypothetical protein